MEYPIIDTLTNAYIRNGWTGLDISTGERNIFDYTSLTWTNGTLTDEGEFIPSNISHFCNEYIPVKPNTEYTISGTFFTSDIRARIYFRTSDGTWISRTAQITESPYTFTTPNNCYNIQLQCPIGLSLSDVQIETRKNIFDYTSLTWTNGTLTDEGEFIPSNVSHFCNEYIPVQPNTEYTISGTFFTSDIRARIYFRTSDDTWISRTAQITESPYTFTTPNNCYNIQLQCPIGLSLSDVQIEKGNQATPYEPYYPTSTDIFSRTRLPIIRHYPYSLIDALHRAAAGTQTADDIEVLRRYLTPLGIGGI